MANIHPLIGGAFLALGIHAQAQTLDDAEVRISYGELKQILSRAEPPKKAEAPHPVLLSARLRLALENDRPVIQGTFRTTSFSDDRGLIPLIAGDVTLESQTPEDALVTVNGDTLCLVSNKSGTRILELRLLPVTGKTGFSITIPPCPSVIFETGDLPDDHSVILKSGDTEETLAAGSSRPLANSGQTLGIRLLDSSETREALRPPEPSTWTWQNQALVIPEESDLTYQILSRASAAAGSGIEALLPLPSDARDIKVSGEDLISHRLMRGENRSLDLSLVWKTRDVLDRELVVSYRLPLRPLDRTWKLHAPGGADTLTRFLIATTPVLAYAADGLSGPLSPQGLPATLASSLNGATCQHLEGSNTAELTANPVPVAVTDEGVVKQAEWSVKIEPDGSMLATGIQTIEHKGPLKFTFDTPPGMKLLSCELNGQPVSPVDLGTGNLMVTFPPRGDNSRLVCSFTLTGNAFDPVEGTLKLSLPQTPFFIHSLLWRIDLPEGYHAETHGNLTRVPTTGDSPSRIVLRKNLCRDERPEVHVFYLRSDLNR